MKTDARWTDGTKIRGVRVLAAFNRGVLVERRPTPGGVSRWIARCEYEGCEQTYDFTEISSRRTAERRCGLHVSRKNVKGGRIFFDEIEVIGENTRKAFFDGRILNARRDGPRSVKWTILCSVSDCKNTFRMSSLNKSSSRFQLCKTCNLSRMKIDAAKDQQATGRRDRRFVWTDGSWIVGRRIQEAFLAGKLAGKEGTKWLAFCEELDCRETYNFSATTQLQSKQARCTMHTVKKAPPIKSRKKILINGHWTTNHDLASIAANVIWKKVGPGHSKAYVNCRGEKCSSVVLFKRGRNSLLCKPCAGMKRRLRPFEAIFNLWRTSQVARNKKRTTPVRLCLNYEQFAEFCASNPFCFFCKKDIGRLPYVHSRLLESGKRTNVRAPYVDRIDPAGHYTLDNIVSCCGPCNMSKNIFVSHNEMILLGKLRTGKFIEAVEQIRECSEEFKKWGKEVSTHSSYWAGARGWSRKKPSAG